jgi:4-hydroxy-3-methylbut-2-enyl diphosphate reductase IspH
MATTMSRAEAMYQPYQKHPELFGDVFLQSWLHPDLVELVQAFENNKQENNKDTATTTTTTTEDDPTTISSLLREEVPQAVYSFECFSTAFLQQFNEELEHFYEMSKQYKIPVRRPNSSK